MNLPLLAQNLPHLHSNRSGGSESSESIIRCTRFLATRVSVGEERRTWEVGFAWVASSCSAARVRVLVGLAARILGLPHHFYCCLRSFNVTPQVSGESAKRSEERRRSGEYEERRKGARSDDLPTLGEDAPTEVSIK
jgi:hypothetical protein